MTETNKEVVNMYSLANNGDLSTNTVIRVGETDKFYEIQYIGYNYGETKNVSKIYKVSKSKYTFDVKTAVAGVKDYKTEKLILLERALVEIPEEIALIKDYLAQLEKHVD